MNRQQIQLFASKKTDDWETPKELYAQLNKEFKFNFDPCPLNSNFDGLKVDWIGNIFVNPPYSKITSFLKKGKEEIEKGNAKIIVYLIFSNTDTKWFHDYVYNKCELRFIKGRLKFSDGKTPAMRPSMLCIFRGIT